MARRITIIQRIVFCVAMSAWVSACSSGLVQLRPQLPADYTKLGRVGARACGVIIPYAGAEQFLPIMVPSRIDRAYATALASAPGATVLTDVTIEEDWMWPVLGLYICTTISGEAVR